MGNKCVHIQFNKTRVHKHIHTHYHTHTHTGFNIVEKTWRDKERCVYGRGSQQVCRDPLLGHKYLIFGRQNLCHYNVLGVSGLPYRV
jgi:hypothetical protein